MEPRYISQAVVGKVFDCDLIGAADIDIAGDVVGTGSEGTDEKVAKRGSSTGSLGE